MKNQFVRSLHPLRRSNSIYSLPTGLSSELTLKFEVLTQELEKSSQLLNFVLEDRQRLKQEIQIIKCQNQEILTTHEKLKHQFQVLAEENERLKQNHSLQPSTQQTFSMVQGFSSPKGKSPLTLKKKERGIVKIKNDPRAFTNQLKEKNVGKQYRTNSEKQQFSDGSSGKRTNDY